MSKFAPASCDSLKNSKLRLEPSDNCRDPDELFMLLALEEAKRAWRISPPNPSVGAVIVRDGRMQKSWRFAMQKHAVRASKAPPFM